jgi:Protein of unknown function (DUF2865)
VTHRVLKPSMSALGATIVALTAVTIAAAPVSAQSWWPFGGGNERPTPREPVNRPPLQEVPAPIPQPPPNQQGAAGSSKNPICLQLEQRLIQEGQQGNQVRDQLPRIEAEIRTVDKTFNVGATQLDRSCYETFLFTKTFRATPQCKELQRQVEGAKRRLSELEAQRHDAMGSAGRSYKDDIIRELARNNCGANYVDQARRNSGGAWGGGEEETIGSGGWAPQGNSGVATYRTICVRLCDGFYFPVSFSTLPSHFPQDAEVCSSKCVAPTELYYYPNPGGNVDQSVALKSQEAYTKLKVAFRYRKEFVNGCSCKEAEYVPASATDKKVEGAAPTATTPKTSAFPAKRAELPPATGAQIVTGSTAAKPAAASVKHQEAPPVVQEQQPQ